MAIKSGGYDKCKVSIVGMGPGDKRYLTCEAQSRIKEADIVIGSSRCLETFSGMGSQVIALDSGFDRIKEIVKSNPDKKIAIAVSGDTGIFSLATRLRKQLLGIQVDAVPGISSLQYLCAKIGETWNDAKIISLHGRDMEDLEKIIMENPKTILFTGGKNSPTKICSRMKESEIGHLLVKVGENLSYENERITSGTAENMSKSKFADLSIMVVYGGKSYGSNTWGIRDEEFIRGNIPMTKEEVRTLSISKLKVNKGDVVWDIGAGTGSVSVQCALSMDKGVVYAIERNPEGVDLINKNSKKFRTQNIKVVEGTAPSALLGLPEPDRVFIGGSGGNIGEIINSISKFDRFVRVVVNAITIETAYNAIGAFEELGFRDVDITQLGISKGRKVGKSHLLESLNPIFIISAEKGLA